MEQITFPIFKSPQMRPFLYPHLVTSTPDSHQISKKIKGILAYSEHYKDNCVNYRNIGSSFPPLRTREYRKARELIFEIRSPLIQTSFLERFLKSQTNLHAIRIKVWIEKGYKGEILKRLCEILSKIGRLNRVHIDFNSVKVEQVRPQLIEGIRSMRLLPRLKDLDVTVKGQRVVPFSASLARLGFDSYNPAAEKVIQKLIQKTSKFYHLDTIKIDGACYHSWFVDGLFLIIPKLPNFRELDLDYSKSLNLSVEQILKILDTLTKSPRFEILRLGSLLNGRSQISVLKHPLFKAKSLKRTSFSLHFVKELCTPGDLRQVFDLLGEMPSLYELSLTFDGYPRINHQIAEGQMEKISRMTSIRKLKVMFPSISIALSEKQAENIFRSVFKMHFLEELDLWLPQDCLGGNARDIEGLPRLKKVSLHFERWKSDRGNDMIRIAEILGKCHQLRELELKFADRVYDYQGLMMKLRESLRKLKKLQVFKLDARTSCEGGSNMTIDVIEDLVKTCDELKNLQDLTIQMMGFALYKKNPEAIQRYLDFVKQFGVNNRKYRHSDLSWLC